MTRPYPDERLEIAVQALSQIRECIWTPKGLEVLDSSELASIALDALREIERLTAIAPTLSKTP